MTNYVFSPPPAEADRVGLVDTALVPSELYNMARHPQAGALVLFSGEVRNHTSTPGKVLFLEYEAHEKLAHKCMQEIVTDARSKFELLHVTCLHRLGKVEIMESAVVVITAAAHRQTAYEANQYILERVKYEAPIWKKEYFEDGSTMWGHNSNKTENNK